MHPSSSGVECGLPVQRRLPLTQLEARWASGGEKQGIYCFGTARPMSNISELVSFLRRLLMNTESAPLLCSMFELVVSFRSTFPLVRLFSCSVFDLTPH